MAKLTKAQREFIARHRGSDLLPRWPQLKTYDFLGRLRDAGMIEIVDGNKSGWPYSWEGTRLTDAGRAALTQEGKNG